MAGDSSFVDAILAVHAEVRTLPKDGWNDQGGYSFAKGDTVVREARKLLSKHGIAYVRTGARLTPPSLDRGTIGTKMSYVGNVEITGRLMHAKGELEIVAEAPIVAMSARPHDKAWAATLTFASGYLLLGVLNQDKADGAEISEREDVEEPLCVGKAAPIAESNASRCGELAAIDGVNKHSVWAYVCGKAGVPRDDNGYPAPQKLYVSEGKKVGEILKALLAQKSVPGDEPDQREDPAAKGAP